MIGVIGFNSLHVMQYLYKYTDALDRAGVPFEVVYWDRTEEGEPNPFEGRSHVLHLPTVTHMPFQKKLGGFLRYTRFMMRTVRRQRYDKLILLTTQTAVALSLTAHCRYRGRYVFDFRDLTKEGRGWYRRLVERLVNESRFTAISSAGYYPCLPGAAREKFVLSPNLRDLSAEPVAPRVRAPGEPLRLVFWGIIRQEEFQKKLIDRFGGDPRFDVAYHGSGVFEELRTYCAQKGYQNIRFTGRFAPPLPRAYVEEADVLLNTYENDFEQQPALTVKMLDGLKTELPMLVTQGAYMAEYLAPYSVALPVDLDDPETPARVLDWFDRMKRDALREGYARLRARIADEEAGFQRALTDFIKE